MTARKQIAMNAFYMASPTQSWAGLWSHPESNGPAYNQIGFWTELARLCERGLIDAVFLADILGANDAYGGSPAEALRTGTMVPNNDPMMLISAMAAVTRDLGFGITGNTTYETPYLLARRFSTLDQLTQGRVAWNVVTGIVASTAKAVGLTRDVAHDERYAMADEYMEVMYKLWEGSWEDGAALRDRARGVFADPAKVHAVHHHGKYFDCDGIHLSEPSPQRTPLIYAAGASGPGRAFAGRHAECAFMSTESAAFARKTVDAYRDEVEKAGRPRDAIRVFNAATVIAARTRAEALEIEQDIARHSDEVGNIAMFSQWLGLDLSKYSADDPITYVESNAIQSIMEAMTTANPGEPLRLRDLGRFGKVGGREAYFIGSADEVADQMIAFADETGVDGFNLVRTVEPAGLERFVDLVVPALQERGAYKTEYAPGTIREKLFPGGGAHLPEHHRGSSFRVG